MTLGRTITVAVVAVAIGLTACGTDESVVEPSPTQPDTSTTSPAPTSPATTSPATTSPATTGAPVEPAGLEGAWQATSGIVDGSPVELIAASPITLTVADGEASGIAACNSYSGPIELDGTTIRFTGGLASTEIGCEPFETMELEQVYLSSIGPTATYSIDGTTLTIETPTATWTFEWVPPTPDIELVGTEWVLDTVIDEFGAWNAPGMESATLTFLADGTIEGSTGCRSLAGTWIAEDGAAVVEVLDFVGTCEGPSEIDVAVADVLSRGATAVIAVDRLTLSTADGLGLSYTAR